MSSAALHTAVALGFGAAVGAGVSVAHGIAAGITAGALVGAAIFPSWEVGQSRVKNGRSINWPEMLVPSGACLALGTAAHGVVAVVGT